MHPNMQVCTVNMASWDHFTTELHPSSREQVMEPTHLSSFLILRDHARVRARGVLHRLFLFLNDFFYLRLLLVGIAVVSCK